MTAERPSQNRQILEMLNEMKQDIVAIKTKMEIQPSIDEQKHALIDQRFEEHNNRIKGLEELVKWIALVSAGALLTSVLKLVLPS